MLKSFKNFTVNIIQEKKNRKTQYKHIAGTTKKI